MLVKNADMSGPEIFFGHGRIRPMTFVLLILIRLHFKKY